MEDAAVSIVVPCRDGARYLPSLLASLVDQILSESAEIVVVDNGSADDSRGIAERASGRIPVKVIAATERTGAAYARNIGARAATGSKLVFVDADDELAPGYVAAIAAALDQHPFVTSKVDSLTLNDQWNRDCHGSPWQAEGVSVFFDFLPATGVNVGVSREWFEKMGGFPEEFEQSEDIAFSWSLQLEGIRIHFVADAVYRYRYRDSVAGLFRQSRRWGRSNVLLYRRFRESGMPRRQFRRSIAEVVSAVLAAVATRRRDDGARAAVALGYFVGRLGGSIRYRTIYL